MVGNNLNFLNSTTLSGLTTLGTTSFLGNHGNGFGLNLAQINPLSDISLHSVAEALPYIGVTAAGIAALGIGGSYALRLFRQHRASLPPPGMKDIKPEQMQAFFDRHATDRPEQATVLMGFSGIALQEALEETERIIASEREDLAEALKAEKSEKARKTIESLLLACTELEALVSIRRGNVGRASEKWLTEPDKALAFVVDRLTHLRRYRLDTADRFFRETGPRRRSQLPDTEFFPEVAARYAALDKRQRAALFGVAVSVWQSLPIEHKNFFWDLLQPGDKARGVMLPPDFLTLFAVLMPRPKFPLNTQELTRQMPLIFARWIETLNSKPELPPHFRNLSNCMVFFRHREQPTLGGVRILRKLGKATVAVRTDSMQKVRGDDGAEEVKSVPVTETFSPEQILTIRNANDVNPHVQGEWTHPRLRLHDDKGKEIPGLVMDMRRYPAHSLGEGHHVLVDYMDPNTVHFLESIKNLKEKFDAMNEEDRDPVAIAEALWKHFQKHWGTLNLEKLESGAGQGKLHGLVDVVKNSGEVELAILLQMAFQYLGIPSRLEQGRVKMVFSRGRTDLDPEGPIPVMWLRLMIPGRRERILCGRLNEPIAQDHPAFGSFTDQTHQSGPHSAPGPISGTEDTVMAAMPGTTASVLPPAASVIPPALPNLTPPKELAEELEPQDDVTPLPAPLVPQDEDDEGAKTKLFPAVAPEDAFRQTGTPEEHDRVTVVAINPINFEMMKKGLEAELAERYPLLANPTKEARAILDRLHAKIVAAWNEAVQPALENDDNGVPARMPESFIEQVVGKWFSDLQGNSSDVAKKIVAAWVDNGDRATRQFAKVAEASQPSARPLPPPDAETAATPSTPPSSHRATPPPLPTQATEARPAIPPPSPVVSAQDVARAESARRESLLIELAHDALVARYPSFNEQNEHDLGRSLAAKIRARSGGDTGKMVEAAEHYVRLTISLIEKDPAHENRVRSWRGADAAMTELKERYPIFQEADWEPLALSALQSVFHRWQIEHSHIEWDGTEYLIPEKIFEDGFSEYTSQLTKNYPDTDPDVFFQAFVQGDQGNREKRWAAPEPEEETPVSAPQPQSQPDSQPQPQSQPLPPVTDISSVRQRMVVHTPESVAARIAVLYPAMASQDAALRDLAAMALKKESPNGFDLDLTIHTLMSALIRQMADTARAGSPLETRLRAIIEHALSEELKERYRFFAPEDKAAGVAHLASRIYDIWNGHNRTFNGSANAVPLRVPEKFIDEAMNNLIALSRVKDPKTAGEILASFTGHRADRERAGRVPSTPPASNAIPISELTILIELKDRFRETSKKYPDLVRALAKRVYKAWLKKDPERHLEKSHDGLRGLVPEFALEECLQTLFAELEARGLAEISDAMRPGGKDNRGKRTERGTQLVEFDIREEMARRAG